ncbi:MAG TPA: tetratricopeptide repeat protein [Lentimicrobium sp.]|nr:tetratricopeptide repeat protein [Lentimicrobium sp.]
MAAKYRFIRYVLLLLITSALVTACSTKKNTFTRRVYHNLNAHFNAYWNGNESLKEGVRELTKQAKDNYIVVLPVYNYGTQSNATAVNANMDRAIEKASKVIQRHSMYFNDKEYVKWVMYSYLLIGKANYFKQDFNAARRAFEFVAERYPNDPVRYEALLWAGRSYHKLKQYEKAVATFDQLNDESKTVLLPWSVRKGLPIAYADMYIAQGKYTQAREKIESSLPMQSGSKFKTRLYYILGQLYQLEGKDSQATEYFTLAIKGTPSFEMAFNARINLARVYDAGRSDRKMIVNELNKMLKDAKNEDFRDQIYFALADIALKEKNDTLGIKYLRQSVASSVDNDFQKSTSALRLADIYFNNQQYTFAQIYYDTTLNYLPKEYPDYEKISSRTEIISRLVENLHTVQMQDSLQNLVNMPESERLKIIDEAIARYVKKEEEAQKKAEQERLAMEAGIALGGKRVSDIEGQTTMGGGGWYFYNPSAIGMGYTEFTRKWGRRKLEDNWRLSNKRVMNWDQIAEEGAVSDSTDTDGKSKGSGSDMKSRATYLANLPNTPEKVEASNIQIGQALFNAGMIYLEELNDLPKAESTFSNLITRFPADSNALQANYHLYRINRDQGDSVAMLSYKNDIINKYPDSDYAKILIDPDYKAELEAANNRVRTLYEETYQAFNSELYRTVIIYSNDAISNYAGNELIPQFAYLRALALGKTISQDTMKIELASIVKNYPTSPVVPYANILIGPQPKMSNKELAGALGDQPKEEPINLSMYSYDRAASHFYVLIVDGEAVNVYGIKVRINDFNSRNYSVKNLQVNSVILDGNKQMITISSFANSEDAMTYYNHISSDSYIFSGIEEGTFDQFVISSSNYPVFFKDKKVPTYTLFFQQNYLNKK